MDMGLSIGFFAIFALFGSIDYATVFSLGSFMNETAITVIGLLLLTGAMAKSANIPLHSWLPGSMEGPTPVSALIHAATLVTSGLYLLVRSSPILEYSSTALLVITLVGASTAFFAATCGLVQNDLKRIIAFSTISQLGYSLRISYFIAALALHCWYGTLVYFLYYDYLLYILYYDYLFNQFIIDLDFNILMLCNLPLSISQIKDKFLHYITLHYPYWIQRIRQAKDKDCFTDFSSNGKSIIKAKYQKIQGIYLWFNKTNNKSYVGKSVNLYQRINKYFSTTDIPLGS